MFIGSGIRLRSTGNGPALASDFTGMSELPADYTFTRASQAKYFDASGVMQTALTNAPRFDHVYDGTDWVAKGLLIEGARTNLALQSNGFDTTWGNNSSIDTAASGTSPDGSNNAWKITDNGSGGAAQV